MPYCRFQHQNITRYGLIESVCGEETITRILAIAPHSFADFNHADRSELPLSAVRLLSPVEPTKVVCIGRNYREHAIELNHPIPTEPLIFLKPPSSVIGTGDEIRRPNALSQRVDHEGELGVVIGKRCYRLGKGEDVLPYILGYTCVNDVTARDLQNKDGQWTRAKGFDTFCPVGPVVVPQLDPRKGVSVVTRVNGERTAKRDDSGLSLPAGRAHSLHFAGDDSGTRRPDRNRNARRGGPTPAGRYGRGYRGRRWNFEKSRGE